MRIRYSLRRLMEGLGALLSRNSMRQLQNLTLLMHKNKIITLGNLNEISRRSAAMARFFWEFIRMPGQVGSVCPSSKYLAAALARRALASSNAQKGLVVDLGAGTGIVSEQLLKMGIPAANILALDISENFRSQFTKNCRNINLVINDASNLETIIAQDYPHAPIRAIISSLPLRVIPQEKVTEIMGALRHCLMRRGGALAQYTYAIWMHESLRKYGFSLCDRHMVFSNIPPALVEVYLPR